MEVPCRFDDPKDVVAAYIRAMNAWELFATDCPKKDGATDWTTVQQKLDAVFAQFCTVKERSHGRQGSFQSPPEYDPARETVIRTKVESSNQAFVATRRVATIGDGEYRYVLHQSSGRWFIDNLKFKEPDGSYSQAIL